MPQVADSIDANPDTVPPIHLGLQMPWYLAVLAPGTRWRRAQ
jgi:hypothetical protein